MEEDLQPEDVSEEEIRKRVFGKGLTDIHLGYYDRSITRPTIASARRSVIWSRDRKIYETASRQRLQEFASSPYFRYEYPELPKHYPGTWRVVTITELTGIVGRLSRPTTASRVKSAPARSRSSFSSELRDRFKTQTSFPRIVKTPVNVA